MADHRIYPWAGNPRRFLAVAMPNGDCRFGIEGQLVFLTEQRGHCVDRPKYLSRAEAEGLRDALDAALATFGVGAALMSPTAALLEAGARDPALHPVPAVGPYPFRNHGTLADHGFATQEEAA